MIEEKNGQKPMQSHLSVDEFTINLVQIVSNVTDAAIRIIPSILTMAASFNCALLKKKSYTSDYILSSNHSNHLSHTE